MRDVFEYFKFLREAKKSAAALKASELGYVHQSHGIYLDTKTGKYYKSENGQLVPHEMKVAGERGSGAEEEPQGKGQPSLDQFQQQAAKRTDLGSDVDTESPMEDPEVRDHMILLMAKAKGRRNWEQIDAISRKTYIAQATVEYDAMLARKAAEAQAAVAEPEPEPVSYTHLTLPTNREV